MIKIAKQKGSPTAEQLAMAKRIENALEKKNGGNQSELARYIGVSPQAVQKWIAGDSEPKGRNLSKAAEFLEVSAPYLKFGDQAGHLPTAQGPAPSQQGAYSGIERRSDPEALHFNAGPELPIRQGRFVAIVGTGQGGVDGYFSIDDHPPGQGDGEISTNSPDPAAYAIRVRGDSMRPRIKSGEFIIAEPSMQARPGDDVVVRLKDGRAMVKEWQWEREGEISLGSINDAHPPITLQLKLVKSIHRVAAIVPRGSAILKSRED